MGFLALITVLIFFGTLIYFIFSRNWRNFWTYFGINCLIGVFGWLFFSGLIGLMVSSHILAPVEEKYIQRVNHYNIVSLHYADPTYPENMYLESYEDANGDDKYRFAYESNGAYYTKVILPSDVVLGYCAEGVAPSIVFFDVDFDTKFFRFIFFDTIYDYYDVKIPFGSIYIRPGD